MISEIIYENVVFSERGSTFYERVLLQKAALLAWRHSAQFVFVEHLVTNFTAVEGGKEAFTVPLHF